MFFLVWFKAERVCQFQVRRLHIVVDFSYHGSFVNRCSAEWAELEFWPVPNVLDPSVVAALAELVRLMAGKLHDSFAWYHLTIAKNALADLLAAKTRINGSTEPLLRLLQHGLGGFGHFGSPFPNRLSPNK